MTKSIYIFIFYFAFNFAFGQTLENKLLDKYFQTQNEYIYFYGYSPTKYHVGQRIKRADSVVISHFDYPRQNIELFLDSISQKGYKNVKPKTIKKGVNCKLIIKSYNFFSMDTVLWGAIESHIDSCFIISFDIEFSLNGTLNKQWRDTLFTHSRLNEIQSYYNKNTWYILNYFATANIYQIDFRHKYFGAHYEANAFRHIEDFFQRKYF